MNADLSRRNLLRGALQVPLAIGCGALGGCPGDLGRESGPSSPFNKHSSAEEVTAGLDLSGKTALVTGCNSGIGHEILRVLVLRGAHVLAFARTRDKAEEACASVQLAGVRGHATPFGCELSDFNAIVATSDAVRSLGLPIDMLICNAGVNLQDLELVDGLEMNFVVNHLSHFILVNRLLDRVVDATQGRVIVIGSIAYLYAPPGGIELDNLSGQKRPYAPTELYGQSKLANGLFARELARRLTGTPATANVVHPGVVDTRMNRSWNANMPLYWRLYGWLLGLTFKMKSIQQGAATPCYVATNPALAQVSGAYFEDCHLATAGGYMRDDALAFRLWQVSEDLTRPYLRRQPV
jgi:NAD(P)-dependent dehydrogenase (short-subunit alcohol dehydrogenase family)